MKNSLPLRLYYYIAKEFFYKFILLSAFVSAIIFVIDLSELLDSAQENFVPFIILLKIIVLHIPAWLESLFQFLILFATMFTLIKLSHNSEINVIKAGGISVWQFLSPIIVSSFAIGVFVVLIFNPFVALTSNKAQQLENKYFNNELEDFITSVNGIWLRQQYLELENGKLKEKGDIVVRTGKVYKESMILKNVVFVYFDFDFQYLKRINAKKARLEDKMWVLKDVTVIREGEKSKYFENMLVPTNLDKKFILNTLKNKYESVENVPFWQLVTLIRTLEFSGFDVTKFKLHLFYLLVLPFLFVAMVLIASYFALDNIRNNKSLVMLTKGIVSGFFVYIVSNVFLQFGSVGKLSIFNAVWLPTLIYLLVGVMLIIRKEDS